MTGGRKFRQQLLLWLGGTILVALVAYAAPTITSVAGTSFGGNTPFGGNLPAITSGTSLQSFTLVISGSFDPEAFQSVTWLNTVTGQTQTFNRESGVYSVSSTTIYVTIPRVLYATPVSSQQTVEITVDEFVFTASFRVKPRITSLPGTFFINPPLTSLGPVLPAATRGSPYDSPYVSGGTAPYFRGNQPNLPANLSISANSPQNVTGTCNVLGFFTFQPAITDAWGNTLSPQEGLQCVTGATLSSLSPNSVLAGSSNFNVVATGSNFAAAAAVANTAVPGSRVVWFPPGAGPSSAANSGITLQTSVSSSTQLAFLVPANLVVVPGVATVYVLQPNGQYSNGLPFTVNRAGPPPLEITTSTVPQGQVGSGYGSGFDAIGGVPPYQFSLGGGTLPPGLTIRSDGSFFGTPTTPGQFSFSVQVTDNAGSSATRGYSVSIAPAQLTVTGTVSDVAQGSPVNFTFGATGGVPPYAFSAGGSLPTGTVFSNGTLSGTATAQGTYAFTVTVTDSTRASGSRAFTIRVTVPALVLTGSLGNGQVGSPYTGQVGATGGAPPYTFSASGLPAGVSLSTAGAASGTPTTPGTSSVVVTVTDSAGAKASQTFPVVIAALPLSLTTTSLGNGTVGVPYSGSLSAAGGVPPYTWTASGLPAGINAALDGNLSGTPTTPGTSSVSVTVTDSKGTGVTKTLTLIVEAPPLSITTASLPPGMVGAAYSASVGATGGVPPYTFSASGLPDGLSMSAGGSISGTPTVAGSSSVSVTVRDSLGTSASRTLSIAVTLPATPAVTFGGLPTTANPATQPVVTVGLGGAFPVNVTVVLTLTFAPDSGADDPTVQFATGGRTAQVVIPAGSTTAPDLALQTGTVAGTITITARLQAATLDVTPTPVPTRTIRISPTAPVLQSVTATRTSTGFNVVITGFASSRELTQAVFTFTAASGTNLQTTTLTIALDSLFSQYYQSSASAPFGSQFTLTQPFTVSGGTTGIVSVSVTLTSRVGTSNAVSANLQ
jgi:hypothetical protein